MVIVYKGCRRGLRHQFFSKIEVLTKGRRSRGPVHIAEPDFIKAFLCSYGPIRLGDVLQRIRSPILLAFIADHLS